MAAHTHALGRGGDERELSQGRVVEHSGSPVNRTASQPLLGSSVHLAHHPHLGRGSPKRPSAPVAPLGSPRRNRPPCWETPPPVQRPVHSGRPGPVTTTYPVGQPARTEVRPNPNPSSVPIAIGRGNNPRPVWEYTNPSEQPAECHHRPPACRPEATIPAPCSAMSKATM